MKVLARCIVGVDNEARRGISSQVRAIDTYDLIMLYMRDLSPWIQLSWCVQVCTALDIINTQICCVDSDNED